MYTNLSSFSIPSTLGKKSYADIGKWEGGIALKVNLFQSSEHIIKSLSQFYSNMEKHGLPVLILLDVDTSKLFYLDSIYFKVILGSGSYWEFSINLKETYQYRVLLTSYTRDIIDLYENSWVSILDCLVESKIGMLDDKVLGTIRRCYS